MNIYEENIHKVKALADINRIMIVDMLSCGELCACKILEKFNFTQPTLSHHMKILSEAKIVTLRREGKNTYYTLNSTETTDFKRFVCNLLSAKEECICK